MPAVFGLSRPSIRPSVSRRDLIPELGIAIAAVGLTAVVHCGHHAPTRSESAVSLPAHGRGVDILARAWPRHAGELTRFVDWFGALRLSVQ